jgi:hypothetical protein
VESSPLVGIEIVPLVGGHEVNLGSFRKIDRLVQYQTPIPDPRSQRQHHGNKPSTLDRLERRALAFEIASSDRFELRSTV